MTLHEFWMGMAGLGIGVLSSIVCLLLIVGLIMCLPPYEKKDSGNV